MIHEDVQIWELVASLPVIIFGIWFLFYLVLSLHTNPIVYILMGICVLVLVIIFLWVLFRILSVFKDNDLVPDKEVAYYVTEGDIDPEPLKVKDSKKILEIRYAKSAIDGFEYTERMSRL